nr:MAG TPA: hypothetical protein [Caudoviricetes sp.]
MLKINISLCFICLYKYIFIFLQAKTNNKTKIQDYESNI